MSNKLIPTANKQTALPVGRIWEKIDRNLPWDQIKFGFETKSENCSTCRAFKNSICWVNAMSAPRDGKCDKTAEAFRAWGRKERI